jgi:hypothetical protein
MRASWLAALLTCFAVSSAHAQTPAKTPIFKDEIYPPWQHGANNDALERGLEFTVPEVDNLADFHGDITDPKLVLYVGGNYFFAMAPLVRFRLVFWSGRSRPTESSRRAI